ncbi:MAG: endo-1,4-beta-xylanase [Clostridiales bacterium]|nr:endo-1,4-beta-xylanase [Clostridiales bacterium]
MKGKIFKLVAGVLAGMFLLSGCGSTTPTTVAGPHDVPLSIVADFTKKENKGGNWVTYGDCKITLKDGTTVITDRAASNCGIAVPCPDYRGNTVQASVKATTENDSLTVSLRYEIFGNVSYVNIAPGTPNEAGIVEITGSIEIPANAENSMIYLEANDVRDITVTSFELSIVGELNNLTGVPVESLTDPTGTASLSAAYANYFKFGVASPATVMTNPNDGFRQMILTQFNSVTPENELKPENVLDAAACLKDPAKYNESPAIHFDAAKPILDFCKENGISMRGHTLIWHSQTPSWFFYENYDVNGQLASRDLMLKRMENYIDSVINYCETNYPGVIYAWDVCNECIDDGGGIRQSYWTQTIGNDFVEKAFEFARKHAPSNVQLFYNDYNEYQGSKQDDIINLLKPIAAAGNIDGMGMQSHISSGLDPDYYISAAKRYADELGVIIHITELDVTAPKSQNPMYDQGVYMQKLFTAIIEADKAGVPIECVTVWGLTDDMSWKSSTKPLLFYGNLSPKPAYEGVMCAVNGGEVAKPADYVEPVVDTTPFIEDYEDKSFTGGPRYSSVQKIVGDAYEGEWCLENSEGYDTYDGYAVDVSNYAGHTIHVSFAIKSAADQCCLTADIDGTWPHLAEVPTGTGEWVFVECDYTVDAGATLQIYWESSDMSPFYLDSLKIETVD